MARLACTPIKFCIQRLIRRMTTPAEVIPEAKLYVKRISSQQFDL